MKYILDSSVFINATHFPFSKKDEYVMTSFCEGEIKESLAKMRFEVAYKEYNFSITDPCMASIQSAQRTAREHGDTKLSFADESVLALALECVDRGEKVCVYTDDYSLQNLLNWRKIPYSGVQQNEIKKAKNFGKKRVSK